VKGGNKKQKLLGKRGKQLITDVKPVKLSARSSTTEAAV
jgi:hypothetical protein